MRIQLIILACIVVHVSQQCVAESPYQKARWSVMDVARFPHNDHELKKILIINLSGQQIRSMSEIADLCTHKPEDLNDTWEETHLFLGNNELQCIESRSFKSLQSLNIVALHLNNNVIDEIQPCAFEGCGGNLELYLNGNKLTKLPLMALSNVIIKEINVSLNHIECIEEGAFVNQALLEKIDLSYNELKLFNGNIFKPCTKLQELNVSGNLIAHFTHLDKVVNLPEFRALSLRDNKLSKSLKQHLNQVCKQHPKISIYV